MGEIVAAMAATHGPQLFIRRPTEDPAQLNRVIDAMRELGGTLEKTLPDAIIVIANDHLDSFFPASVPTFAIVVGERADAAFRDRCYSLPIHQSLANHLLDGLVHAGFDLAYSHDVQLGHSFAAIFEWIIEGRAIPVIPIFVNTYLPPLPSPRRCEALGSAIAKIVQSRPERVAIIASGGMSHYPGTRKYGQPAYNFDYWVISQIEDGNYAPLLDLTPEQLDEAGNTELLTWMIAFGAIGRQPGELLTYQATWHHGLGVMRFVPRYKADRVKDGESNPPAPPGFKNQDRHEFYKHPSASSYKLNRLLCELSKERALQRRLLESTEAVAAEYGLSEMEARVLETLKDESIDIWKSGKSHPLVEIGAHPLAMLRSLVGVQSEAAKMRQGH